MVPKRPRRRRETFAVGVRDTRIGRTIALRDGERDGGVRHGKSRGVGDLHDERVRQRRADRRGHARGHCRDRVATVLGRTEKRNLSRTRRRRPQRAASHRRTNGRTVIDGKSRSGDEAISAVTPATRGVPGSEDSPTRGAMNEDGRRSAQATNSPRAARSERGRRHPRAFREHRARRRRDCPPPDKTSARGPESRRPPARARRCAESTRGFAPCSARNPPRPD